MLGEYWFTEHNSIYADGDIGDKNHEAIVIEHVASEMIAELADTKFGALADQLAYIEEMDGLCDSIMVREEIINWFDRNHPEVEDYSKELEKELDWATEKLNVALGSVEDARDYGVNVLGWIRVLGNNVQLYGLTKKKLRQISRGFDDSGEEWLQENYHIEDRKNGKFYPNISGYDIADENIAVFSRRPDFAKSYP